MDTGAAQRLHCLQTVWELEESSVLAVNRWEMLYSKSRIDNHYEEGEKEKRGERLVASMPFGWADHLVQAFDKAETLSSTKSR